MDKRFSIRDAGFLGLIVVILLVIVFALRGLDASPEPTSAEVRTLIETQQVDTVKVKDNTLTMVLKDGSTVTAKLYSGEMFYDEFNDILVAQKRAGILTDYNYLPDTILPWYASFLPWLVILGLFALLWYSMMSRQMNAGGGGGGAGDRPSRFSRARTKVANGEGKQVTFADVAGADEEKAELQEVVDFLKEPQRYLELGARIPKGILLVGPPAPRCRATASISSIKTMAGASFLAWSKRSRTRPAPTPT